MCAAAHPASAKKTKKTKPTPPTGAHDYRTHRGINYCVRTGSVDDAIEAYVMDKSKKTLDAVMHKVRRSLAWGTAMQLLEDIRLEFEDAAMAAEDATTQAEDATVKHDFKRIADAVLAATPAN